MNPLEEKKKKNVTCLELNRADCFRFVSGAVVKWFDKHVKVTNAIGESKTKMPFCINCCTSAPKVPTVIFNVTINLKAHTEQ